MGTLTVSRHMEAAPERVFEVMTDLEHAPARISGIKDLKVLTEGPVGLGTRFRETRVMFKREAVEEMEISAFTPGRSYTVEAESCGCHFSTEIRCEAAAGGTDVVMEMTTRPVTFIAKLMTPVSKLMSGPMKKCIMADLDDIKAFVEG